MQRSFIPSKHSLHVRLIAWFILPPIMLLAAGEVYIRLQPNPSKYKHHFLTLHNSEVDTLILGSSHTYYGIEPEVLGKHAFSLAQVSQTLKYDNYLLHHYPFENLRMVILPISDFSLYEELEDGPEWHMASRYRLYMQCDIHSRWSAYGWEFTSFPTYCTKLKQLWTPSQMSWSRQGQGLEYTMESRQEPWDNGTERALHNRYETFEKAPYGMKHLHEIGTYCARRSIKLVLISTPLSESYRKAQLHAQVEDTDKHIRDFIRMFPNTTYLDFRSSKSFSNHDFYDADHLNRAGAHKLTSTIASCLRNAPNTVSSTTR